MNSGPVILKMIECQTFPHYEERAGENYGNIEEEDADISFCKLVFHRTT